MFAGSTGAFAFFHSGSTALTMPVLRMLSIVWGAKAKPPVFVVCPAALLCSERRTLFAHQFRQLGDIRRKGKCSNPPLS
jgi:hypothetical protein